MFTPLASGQIAGLFGIAGHSGCCGEDMMCQQLFCFVVTEKREERVERRMSLENESQAKIVMS